MNVYVVSEHKTEWQYHGDVTVGSEEVDLGLVPIRVFVLEHDAKQYVADNAAWREMEITEVPFA